MELGPTTKDNIIPVIIAGAIIGTTAIIPTVIYQATFKNDCLKQLPEFI